ncbi:MAG: DUF935 family protein [Thermoanaerobaculia bacterium]
MAETVLYDAFGNTVTFDKRPPDRQAEIGRVRDPWAGLTTGTLTPEFLARVLRGNAALEQQMLVAKKLLEDAHVFSSYRNLASAVSKLDWSIEPFDDSAGAKKDAEDVSAMLNGFRTFSGLRYHLVFGEHYPFVAPEILWSRDYKVSGWEVVDAPRWRQDPTTRELRLRTIASPSAGEPVNPRGFVFHSGGLSDGRLTERGLWRKIAWYWLFKHSSWEWLMRFANAYGNPMIWAFFDRAESRDSVLEAITGLAANARAAFPAGTEVKLQEAQRYGTTSLYQAIISASDEAITKLINGHVLNSEAKSGTGTLAGNHAEEVANDNIEAVAGQIAESVQEQVVAVWWGFNRGWDQVESGEIPNFRINAAPPADLTKTSQVYVIVNEALASVGRAIDPSQIEDVFQVRTVEATAPAPPAGLGAAKRRTGTAAASGPKKPKLQTAEDVAALVLELGTIANREQTQKILELVRGAETLDEAIDRLWESVDQLDSARHGEILAQAMAVAEAMGAGDVAEESA